ncbi:hypothetical protein AXF42_Ash002232 [Apostasia shenzhenica]|uniref:Uncharacterized protein n=1 Tax=Apostasia shenzhenica TaxID=1088818 RepID=A0A2I0AMZ1_9ASPA|nr:hypothetical protein AXF42_Ash002232 [Apostasia shenzhenica]
MKTFPTPTASSHGTFPSPPPLTPINATLSTNRLLEQLRRPSRRPQRFLHLCEIPTIPLARSTTPASAAPPGPMHRASGPRKSPFSLRSTQTTSSSSSRASPISFRLKGLAGNTTAGCRISGSSTAASHTLDHLGALE